ncbi:MAG: tyrosine-type recombinase/integrase [Bacteroidales bacterium]|nr:tyrosine-type recombinase/integrase [Bacteroidales bacterium]
MVHTLRHSIASHLTETGTGICYIYQLKRHSNIKTTLVYTPITPNAAGNIANVPDTL